LPCSASRSDLVAVEYVTVPDVEVVSAGMNWRGLTGVYYVTGEHLSDMVRAQDDPLIRSPRVKLGHDDPRFNGHLTSHDPENLDAEPAFGTVKNLRLVEGGAKVVGDLTLVPEWLALALPSAYPTRSAEWVWDHTTAGGNHYLAVLTDVSLGGVWEPAVQDLADITPDTIKHLLEGGPEALAEAVAAQREEEAREAVQARLGERTFDLRPASSAGKRVGRSHRRRFQL
jgi:hypothetical protein